MNKIISDGLFGLTLSIVAYKIGVWLNQKFKSPILNPLLIAVAIIIPILKVFHISYDSYNAVSYTHLDVYKRQNYPFCTIEPNVGVVAVPDKRLEVLAEIYHSQKILPAAIEFVDIAGLVRGASKGEGLGNKFLANIREVDAIVHVVRCFENDDIIHVAVSYTHLDVYKRQV